MAAPAGAAVERASAGGSALSASERGIFGRDVSDFIAEAAGAIRKSEAEGGAFLSESGALLVSAGS